MNASWSVAAAGAIAADWLVEQTAPSSSFGRRSRANEAPIVSGQEELATRRMRSASAVAHMYPAERIAELVATIVGSADPHEIVARVAAGAVLSDDDFFELGRFFDALARVAAIQGGGLAGPDAPYAAADAVREALAPGRTPQRGFYLDDAFDPALAGARRAAEAAQLAYDLAHGRLAERVGRDLGVERVRDGEFTVGSDVALPENVRVVREGATYRLCELVPDAATEAAHAQLRAANETVATREEAVREKLTAVVRANADGIGLASRALGALDSLLARARFAQQYLHVVPEFTHDGTVALVDACFPPLAEELERRGRAYTPISFELNGVAVITGPNMGGKTAALRTLGFAAACVLLGVPVPARAAQLPLFERIDWLGATNAELPAGELLSSFGREVVDARALLESATAGYLVLVDEFARTTSPREGRALTAALAKTLASRGVTALLATHFADVAKDAGVPHFTSGRLGALPAPGAARSVEAALRAVASAMDYRIWEVDLSAEAASDAIALAEALGLDAEVVATARAVL